MAENTIKVLLVDDEQGYINILTKRMAKRNIYATCAYNGSEGIQILRKQDFDVAVLDLKMQDMDGLEVLKVFKMMAPKMPIIMLTGHGSESAAREAVKMGAFDYLTKPCNLSHLIEKITLALKK
ncbi:MAG: response regulator [Desulfobacterales bacterium]|nr:response regulator [Desulfobacterales bacterium]MBF0395803.1 response regulator [Desulfobacterales bacterium]